MDWAEVLIYQSSQKSIVYNRHSVMEKNVGPQVAYKWTKGN